MKNKTIKYLNGYTIRSNSEGFSVFYFETEIIDKIKNLEEAESLVNRM